jgi:A/G-specific adenine glycosylase
MLGLPTTDWRAGAWSLAEARALAPGPGAWREAGAIEHVFTHFSLRLVVLVGSGETQASDLVWTPIETARQAVPSVFRKALELAAPTQPQLI